ncbi:hypothetical protein EI94DRAFT_1682202 [Lactarius quietus]|nr:hypothetical protein EI94DRAFT_1682202 [Lactarius quietus]
MSNDVSQFQDPFKLDLSASESSFPPPQPYQLTTSSPAVASLSFLVWDVLITLDQEVEAIWTKPNKFYAKWLFLFLRHFAVSMQIALLFVGSRLAVNLHYTHSDCVKWYIFQEVGTQVLIATVESILIVRVHALYDRSRVVTSVLVLLFIVENIVMIVTLVGIVPEIGFDPICTVVHSPPRLLFFAVAFVSFETVLFFLTLFKFIVALRNGWGRTPVLFLLVRDGTWAFFLIFVTLCVNAGFYLGDGNSATSSIAFPWLLSMEAFAGARLVLNLHALPFDDSANSRGSHTNGGTLSSHIVFMTNPAAGSESTHHHHHPRTRWDWGGVQENSYESSNSRSAGDDSGTRITESYEMIASSSAKFEPKHHAAKSASSAYTDTCVGREEEGVP